MSHTTTVKTEFKSEEAIRAACKEMGLPEPTRGKFSLFADSEVEGIGVRLPQWEYPVVINTATGEAKYDNYDGKWGKEEHLKQFKRLYATHAAMAALKAKGYTAYRQVGKNNSTVLTVNV